MLNSEIGLLYFGSDVYAEDSAEFSKIENKLEFLAKEISKKSESICQREFFRGFNTGITKRSSSFYIKKYINWKYMQNFILTKSKLFCFVNFEFVNFFRIFWIVIPLGECKLWHRYIHCRKCVIFNSFRCPSRSLPAMINLFSVSGSTCNSQLVNHKIKESNKKHT